MDSSDPSKLSESKDELIKRQQEELLLLRSRLEHSVQANIISDEYASDIITLKNQIEEKDDQILTLESRVEELEDDLEDKEEEVEEFKSPSSKRPPPHFKLPDERNGMTHAFRVGLPKGLGKGYLTVGLYPDTDEVGEIFIKMRKTNIPEPHTQDPEVIKLHKEVSDLSSFLLGILDQLAIAVSIGLQRGIPLDVYAKKYRGTRFDPSGPTKNPLIPFSSSLVDYIFRYLGYKYIKTEEWKVD